MKLSNLDFKKVFHYVIISNRTLEKILLKIKILITLEKNYVHDVEYFTSGRINSENFQNSGEGRVNLSDSTDNFLRKSSNLGKKFFYE